MSDIVERLRKQVGDDHVRGCQGRQYACSCGYDLATEGLLEMAAARIEQLEAALRFMLSDPPAALDEPDTDAEIIKHYREVARAALTPKREENSDVGPGFRGNNDHA